MTDFTFLEPWLLFFTSDTSLRLVQLSMLLTASVLVFFVFFVTRDILLRTQSFIYQVFCILLVAFLPGIGFLFYLLIRPARTIKERELFSMVDSLASDKKVKGK